MFSCEYCEIFKNSFFIENLWWLLLYIHLFLIKFKKRLQHRCFPVNIAKFLRIPILKNIKESLTSFGDRIVYQNNLHANFELDLICFSRFTLVFVSLRKVTCFRKTQSRILERHSKRF